MKAFGEFPVWRYWAVLAWLPYFSKSTRHYYCSNMNGRTRPKAPLRSKQASCTHCLAPRTSGFEGFLVHSAQVYLHLVSEAVSPRHPFSEQFSVPPLSGQPVQPLGPFSQESHVSQHLWMANIRHRRFVSFIFKPKPEM